MTWRSQSLRALPIAFPLLLPPDGTWARSRGHAHGHHHDHHHPSHHHVRRIRPSVRLRPMRMRLVSGVRAHARPRLAAVLHKEDTGRARAARGEQIRGEIDAPVHYGGHDRRAGGGGPEDCPVSCGRGFKCAGSWGSADAPECVYVRVTSLTLVAYCSVQGEHEQCENSWSPYW